MTVSDNTMQAEGLGDIFMNLVKKDIMYQKNGKKLF